MTQYNTGNALGSSDPKDLYDNAQNLDYLVNGPGMGYADRLGVMRKSWAGIEEDFQQFLLTSGYVVIGSYAAGITFTARNQVMIRGGFLYRPAASVTLPYTTTGDWGTESSNFVAVADQSLRQDLAANSGASLIGYGSQTVADALDEIMSSISGKREFYLDDFGAVGDWSGDVNVADGTDDSAAFQAAFDAARAAGGGVVYGTSGKNYRITRTIFYPGNFKFDGRNCKIMLNALAEGSAFLPWNFQTVGIGSWGYISNIVFQDLSINCFKGNNWGNGFGVMGAQRVFFHRVSTDWMWFHQVDACAGREVFIDECKGYSGRSAFWQADAAVTAAAVAGVDAAGNAMPCPYSANPLVDTWAYCDGFWVTRSQAYGAQIAGVHFHNTGNRRLYVYNNLFSGCEYGVYSDDGLPQNDVEIVGNTVLRSTIALNLLGNHRQILIANNTLFTDVRDTKNLINMRGEVIDDTARCRLKVVNNLFLGAAKSVTIGHYKDALIAGNFFGNMGATTPANESVIRLDAVNSWALNLYGVDSYSIADNTFEDIVAETAVYTHAGNRSGARCIHGVFKGNRSYGSGCIALLCEASDLEVSNNTVQTNAGAFHSMVIDTNSRIRVNGNSLTYSTDTTNLASVLKIYNCVGGVDGNNIQGAAGGGPCLQVSGGTIYSSNNLMFSSSVKINLVSGVLEAAEPFIASGGFSKTAGSFNYKTYTTASL